MHSENLRGAKRRAQNLRVTEAPLEQFSKEGGKMISGGGGSKPQIMPFYKQKTGKSRATGLFNTMANHEKYTSTPKYHFYKYNICSASSVVAKKSLILYLKLNY